MILSVLAMWAFASPAAIAAEPLRIVAFGDSLTAGLGLPEKDAFPVKLQAALRAKGHDVEVINAGVSGDTNPVHLDEEFASTTPFKGRIAHGMLTASLISTVLGTKLPGPGCVYVSQSVRFLAPVRVGDTVRAMVTIREVDRERRRVTLETVCKVNGGDVLIGATIVNGDRGTDNVHVNELTATTGTIYTLTSSTLSRPGFGGLQYSGIEALELSAQRSTDTIHINSTAPGVAITIDGDGGPDTLVVPNATSPWNITGSAAGTGNAAWTTSPGPADRSPGPARRRRVRGHSA